MDKITYLAELAEGLARWVPERERQDILRYYAEYFEEAGPEREAEVVAELGDPWALSCRLAVEGGYVTHEKAASWTPRKKWPRILIGTAVGLSIFALVSSIGMLAFNFRFARTEDEVKAIPVDDPQMGAVFGYTQDEAVTIIDAGNAALIEEGSALSVSYFTGDGSLEAFSSIDADVALGNVQVVAGDDYTLYIRWSKSLTDYKPVVEVRDGILRLRDCWSQQTRIDNWADLNSLFGVGQGSIEVTITIPEGAMLDKVSVRAGVGDVLLWGVNAESVTAEAGVGDVACYEARNVGQLKLGTGVGDVGLSLDEVCPGLYASLKAGVGDLEASLGCSEADCDHRLSSGLGAVTVNGSSRANKTERNGNTFCTLTAESGTGSVNVHFTYD